MADNDDFLPPSQMDETKDNYPPSSRSRDTAATYQDIPTGIDEANRTEGTQPEQTTASQNTNHPGTDRLHYCPAPRCKGHNDEEWTVLNTMFPGQLQAYADASRGVGSTSRPDLGSGGRSETQNPNPYATAGTFPRGPLILTGPQALALLITLSNQTRTADGSQNDPSVYFGRIPRNTRSHSQFGPEQTGENTNEETEREE
ncbi:hypothetical protein M231_05180 [Tremella mesenterica]|uniref:Uncharacterized protein n=1 Tax=Tremella mesenterica TaxID=5217 RepID=A0A4Q1BIV5_TREME|nr:hypothetical protein M231_05180 [Tremella mesenterica]